MNKIQLTQAIKSKALELGFELVGVAKAEFMETEARQLETWLNENQHGKMSWIENYFDKRVDPRKLVDGAKSVISILHNYHPEAQYQQAPGAPKISTYAWGKDYHKVLKFKLFRLLEFINETVGAEPNARVFTDSAPVMDKAWAKRAGLGWIGKHSNLIVPQKGSFYFIGELIIDLELEYDAVPVKDFCGTCTRCIDACPTDALTPYRVDARRCISYLTIELREDIPSEFANKMEGWAYGCDICMDVCPWNRFAKAHVGEEFKPLDHILNMDRTDWEELDEKAFKRVTKKTAMNRVKWDKMKNNLKIIVND